MCRQGMESPRRVLAAANTSPPLPASPDQTPASLAPEPPAQELTPLRDSFGVEDSLDGAADTLKGERLILSWLVSCSWRALEHCSYSWGGRGNVFLSFGILSGHLLAE